MADDAPTNDLAVMIPKATPKLEMPHDAILDGTNFADWKMVVTSVLEQHGLELTLTDPNLPNSKTRSVKTFLLFSMNKDHRTKISHCTSAFDIWQAISNIYQNNSKRAVNTLWKRLFNFKIASYAKVNEGISEMQGVVSELKTRKVDVPDSCLIGCIECALPDEFKDWLINWSMRESEPSLNELINSITNFIETIKSTENRACAAFTSKDSKTPEGDIFCRYCKRKNHVIADCRILARKQAEKDKAQKPEIAMMAHTNTSDQSSWLLDSGASLHMTCNKQWLSDYTPLVSPVLIRLGDDQIIEAKGYGTVRTTNAVLHNFHYVPDIKTNLFSIPSTTNNTRNPSHD